MALVSPFLVLYHPPSRKVICSLVTNWMTFPNIPEWLLYGNTVCVYFVSKYLIYWENESSPRISSPCSSPKLSFFNGLLSIARTETGSEVKVALLKNRALAALKLNSWQEAQQRSHPSPENWRDETGDMFFPNTAFGRLITWFFLKAWSTCLFLQGVVLKFLKDDVMGYRTCYIGTGHGSYVGRKWIMTIASTRAIVPTTAALYCLEMTAIKIRGNHHYPNDINVQYKSVR